MEVHEGDFILGPETAIVCDPQAREEAEYLRELLQTYDAVRTADS